MRIALVSREVHPFYGAGIGAYTGAMARAWRGEGHEVHVISQEHPDFNVRGPKELAGAVCHSVRAQRSKYFFAGLAAGARRTLLKLHAKNPFDYIEFPEYFAEGYFAIRGSRLSGELAGAVLGMRLHTPTHECRALNQEGPGGDEVTALERCESAAILGADLVLSPSRSLMTILKNRIPFAAPSFVVPYPFESDRVSIAAGPSDEPLSDRTAEVLYFGRLEKRKGVDLLMKAALSLLERGVDVSFTFIGSDTQTGPGGQSMRRHLLSCVPERWHARFAILSNKLQEEVFWRIRAVVARGGLCCFPSVWENFPNACLEAMSLGAPVVGSDSGGMSEIIEDGISGVLFKSGDATSLASALSGLLTSEALRKRISAEAPQRIAALCSPTTVVNQTIGAIDAARVDPLFGKRRSFDEVPLPVNSTTSPMSRLMPRWFR